MKPGDQIRDYRILDQLGEGGMGVVFAAEQATTGARVVIKGIVSAGGGGPDATQLQQRLRREAMILTSLQHDNIVGAREWFEEAGELFLVLEHVDGVPLDGWLESGPSLRERLTVIRQITAALEFAHSRGVIHRDLKPANVMVVEGPRAKLLDFGLARALDSTQLTRAGAVMGTIAYMAPEQARGKEVDARADLFSVGMMLALMVGVAAPFRAKSAMSTYSALLSPEPIEIDDWLPADVRDGIARALKKSPDERFQTAAELGAFIDGLLADPEDLEKRIGEARKRPAAARNAPPRLSRVDRPAIAAAAAAVVGRLGSRRGTSVVILAPPGAGRSTALAILGEQLAASGLEVDQLRFVDPGQPQLVLFDYLQGKGLLEAVGDIPTMLTDGEETIVDAPAAPVGPGAIQARTATGESLSIEESVEVFLSAVESRVATGSLALLIDDVQLAAESELGWVNRLLQATTRLPLVVALAGDGAREGASTGHAEAYAGFLSGVAAADDLVRLSLAPLADEEVEAAIRARGVPDDVAAAIAHRGGGSPGVVHALLEHWHAGGDVAGPLKTGPARYLARLRERWGRLDEAQRKILAALLEAGGELEVAAVAAAAGIPRLSARSRLRELEEKHGWVRTEGNRLRLTQPFLAALERATA